MAKLTKIEDKKVANLITGINELFMYDGFLAEDECQLDEITKVYQVAGALSKVEKLEYIDYDSGKDYDEIVALKEELDLAPRFEVKSIDRAYDEIVSIANDPKAVENTPAWFFIRNTKTNEITSMSTLQYFLLRTMHLFDEEYIEDAEYTWVLNNQEGQIKNYYLAIDTYLTGNYHELND